MRDLKPTLFQERLLSIPEDVNIFAGGGRGGGKTVGAIQIAMRHCQMHGELAHILVTREHLRALSEFQDEVGGIFSAVFPKGLRINKNETYIRTPQGATLDFAPLSNSADYSKLQGRNFSLI